MRYKIELRYFSGWDDAGWTEEMGGETKSLVFESLDHAQSALDELFADVKVAVIAGDMDTEEVHNDYRIVPTNDLR